MNVEKFFKVLQCALWRKEFDECLSSNEFLGLMATAEQQTVMALVFDVLSGLNIGADRNVVLKYAGMSSMIQHRNQTFNFELKDFVRCCNQSAIDTIVVKGQTISSLYPKPLLRISGDIDFLIRDDYQSCKSHIEDALKVTLPSKMVEKEVSFIRSNVLYELHNSLIAFGSKRNVVYWEKMMAEEWMTPFYTDVEGSPVRTLSPTVNAVYLFVHLFFHLIREGVGLRQFCDWAVFLHAYRDNIDNEKLKEILEHLGIAKAYRAFGYILVNDLGLPSSSFPLDITKEDKKWRKTILQDIFKGGNFGKQNHKAQSSLLFKMETVKMAVRNSFRYYPLAPREVGMLVPRLIKMNLRLFAGVVAK